MLRRIGLGRSLLLAALVLGSAACDDESPTLSSDPLFPGGAPPVTREVIFPAGSAFRTLGTFTGFTSASGASAGFRLVANRFAGELSATTLIRTSGAFPRELRYTQDNQNRTDTLFRVVSGTLVLRVDSAASSEQATLRVFRLGQSFDPATATYELASDTGGVKTPFQQPGGTRGPLLASAEYRVQDAGDSVVVSLDSAGVNALRDTTGFGILLDALEANRRIQINAAPVLRVRFRPSNAARDTVIENTLDLAGQPSTFVFTPEPPVPAGVLVAGGVRSTRTLFSLELPDSLPRCAPPQAACGRVALRDVRLNRVALVLRRAPVPAAFAPQDSTLVSLFSVAEPELGRRAPLGTAILDPNERVSAVTGGGLQAQRAAVFAPSDTTVELALTGYATALAAGDTLPTSFALLGGPGVGVTAQRGGIRLYDYFAVATFLPEPRLRIVYTLPVRSELP
jgi:hypothetical protein